ncbi:hypothetical protein Tco_0376388 [Tanacetum coccineum]
MPYSTYMKLTDQRPAETDNRLSLAWQARIKLHLEREMEFNQWRSKIFKGIPLLLQLREEWKTREKSRRNV